MWFDIFNMSRMRIEWCHLGIFGHNSKWPSLWSLQAFSQNVTSTLSKKNTLAANNIFLWSRISQEHIGSMLLKKPPSTKPWCYKLFSIPRRTFILVANNMFSWSEKSQVPIELMQIWPPSTDFFITSFLDYVETWFWLQTICFHGQKTHVHTLKLM